MRRTLLAALLIAGFASMAFAETWPSRPIRAVIPFGPGSAVDIVPRIVFEQMAAQLGQSIVVENRAGARRAARRREILAGQSTWDSEGGATGQGESLPNGGGGPAPRGFGR